jgi:diguanylate cyclase (GGDEF)-like protein/PAS domain S-box-containing protein
MSQKPDADENDRPMLGQSARLPGIARSAALHDQLYRYAEDLQQLIERNGRLEQHFEALRDSCDQLTESRDELDRILHASRDIHVVTDPAGVIVQTNPAAERLAPRETMSGCKLDSWVQSSHSGDFLAMQQGLSSAPADGAHECELYLNCSVAGNPTMIVIASVIGVRRDGELHFLHWVLRDVTHMRETEFESRLSSMVFKSSAEGIIITDIEGEILAVNPAFTRITGYSSAEVIGKNPRLLNSGIQSRDFYVEFWRALREEGVWQGEIYNRRKNGEIYPEWLNVTTVRGNDGQILSYIAVLSDLSRLLAAEKQLAYLAHYDALTQLPNRHLFSDRLERGIAQARRAGQRFALLFVDLDNFKPVNDSHGHLAGDVVLKEIATRLVASVRESDTVARLGGDEFVIIAPGLSGEAEVGRFCAKLIDAIASPITFDGHELVIGGSFGCAVYPEHGSDGLSLLKRADDAMYRAKKAGGGRYALYGPLPKLDPCPGAVE